MPIKIAIINCYADEAKSAPSAQLFVDNIHEATIVNHCHGEKIDDISQYDGFIISGSRSCYKDNDSWIIDLKGIIKQIYDENIPCLAVCFGHQVVADMFGGNTVRSIASEEGFKNVPTVVGDTSIKLFSDLPNPVKVYQSHNDAVIKSPKGSIQVIYNEKCVQYYQFGSIYSIQSHPEITVPIAVELAKKENKSINTILNGVNNENIQSHKVLENFSNIVKQTIQF